jgi:hypothetical protein
MAGEINYLIVAVAAVANMVLGMIWYSQQLFGKQWMHLMGISREQMQEGKKKGMGRSYAVALISSLVMAYVLAMFINLLGVVDASGAWKLAFWIWLGFLATTMLGSVLWEQVLSLVETIRPAEAQAQVVEKETPKKYMTSGGSSENQSQTPVQKSETDKIGRNDIVVIQKGTETQELKYKKAEPLLAEGWTIKEVKK